MANGSTLESSDSLKAFGAALKTFRERALLTQEQLAERLSYSHASVASAEQGRRMPTAAFVERAEETLEAFGVLRAMARHVGRQRGPAVWFREWAQLEETAVGLCTYECRVVPGLLQTEAYTRAVMLDVPPPPTEEQLEQRIAARLARQELLGRKPPIAFSFIVEESVLLRHTGGEEVTRELLGHLLACTEPWNVELQIMPLRQPHHAGTDGPMRLLETPERQWVGYAEGQKTGQLVSDREAVSVMQMRYAKMHALTGPVPGGLGGVVAADARSAMSTYGEPDWFKSSHSGSEGDDCVEVAFAPDVVHVRDSKTPDGPRFAVSSSAWCDFLGGAGR